MGTVGPVYSASGFGKLHDNAHLFLKNKHTHTQGRALTQAHNKLYSKVIIDK